MKELIIKVLREIVEENTNPQPDKLSPSEQVAAKMSKLLNQNYREFDGKWYIFNGDLPVRALSNEEVEEHVRMGRAPFVEGGIEDCEDVRWWRGQKTNI